MATESQAWLTPCQCSPYYQNTALHPMIELLERVALRFDREESPAQKLRKLEGFVVQYGLPLAEAVPLLASLLSLPLTADYAPLTVSPEQQKQKTLHALLTIFLRIAAQQPCSLSWKTCTGSIRPRWSCSSLLVDQGPTARILALWTFRPDFNPPWTGRSHLTQVTLPRLPRRQAAEMTGRVAHGKALPPEVVEQVVAKTDGVPLFVEELTKMVLESGLLQEREERYELTGPLPPLAIPTTLHDSLMARLDRLATVKGLAQLGATLGREFSYALLQAVSPWDEGDLATGAAPIGGGGVPVPAGSTAAGDVPLQARPDPGRGLSVLAQEHAAAVPSTYCAGLRGALSRDSARPNPSCWPSIIREAGLAEPGHCRIGSRPASAPSSARPIWKRSAISPRGLRCSRPCRIPSSGPGKSWRADRPWPGIDGHQWLAAPEVEQAYTRARELCQQVGETPQLFPVLLGLWTFYLVRAEFQTARDLGEQLLSLAQRNSDPALLLQPIRFWGLPCSSWASVLAARTHLEHVLALYDPQQHRAHTLPLRA